MYICIIKADKAFLIATQNDQKEDLLRLTSVNFQLLREEEDDEEWTDYDAIYKESLQGEGGEDGSEVEKEEELRSVFPIEEDDEVVLADTKNWVRKSKQAVHIHFHLIFTSIAIL